MGQFTLTLNGMIVPGAADSAFGVVALGVDGAPTESWRYDDRGDLLVLPLQLGTNVAKLACQKQAPISVDFTFDQALITDRSLSIEIEASQPGGAADVAVPLAQAGNPTINVRLLLREDGARP